MRVLKLTNKAALNQLLIKRGQNVIVPVYDGNGDLILPLSVLSDPVYNDLHDFILDKTEEVDHIFLGESFRFANVGHKRAFQTILTNANRVHHENNSGDVVRDSVVDLFLEQNPATKATVLSQAVVVNRTQELIAQGVIIEIQFPRNETLFSNGIQNNKL